MKHFIAILATISLLCSCNKQDSPLPLPVNNAKELLTNRPWVLTHYGYDTNKNNVIDPSEEMLTACEVDNIYFFNTNNSGKYIDNLFTCPGKPAEQAFTWSLTADGKKIDFVNGIADVITLDDNNFVIAKEHTDAVAGKINFLTVFHRM